jgi:hypothetical protein
VNHREVAGRELREGEQRGRGHRPEQREPPPRERECAKGQRPHQVLRRDHLAESRERGHRSQRGQHQLARPRAPRRAHGEQHEGRQAHGDHRGRQRGRRGMQQPVGAVAVVRTRPAQCAQRHTRDALHLDRAVRLPVQRAERAARRDGHRPADYHGNHGAHGERAAQGRAPPPASHQPRERHRGDDHRVALGRHRDAEHPHREHRAAADEQDQRGERERDGGEVEVVADHRAGGERCQRHDRHRQALVAARRARERAHEKEHRRGEGEHEDGELEAVGAARARQCHERCGEGRVLERHVPIGQLPVEERGRVRHVDGEVAHALVRPREHEQGHRPRAAEGDQPARHAGVPGMRRRSVE